MQAHRAGATHHVAAPVGAGPQVKICGLVRREDAEYAARAGAAFVGSIFAGGPRQVNPAVARLNNVAARAAARAAGNFPPKAVAVLGGQSVLDGVRLARAADADIVQLHADPDADAVWAMRRAWGGPVWAALRIEGTVLPPHAADLFAAADAVVLDARVAGALGGTGVVLPWRTLAESLAAARGRGRLVLAGGLRASTVAEAVAALGPDVVDVSSGVESAPGVKRYAEVLHFVTRARQARPAAPGPPPAA